MATKTPAKRTAAAKKPAATPVAVPAAPAKKTATAKQAPAKKTAKSAAPVKKPAAPVKKPTTVKQAPAPVAAAGKVVRTTEKAYLPAAERGARLDAVVLKLLKKDGIAKLTRTAVAAAAGCSNSLLTVYFTNAAGLRVKAVQLAADAGDLKTVRKAIADGFDVKTLTRKAQTALRA